MILFFLAVFITTSSSTSSSFCFISFSSYFNLTTQISVTRDMTSMKKPFLIHLNFPFRLPHEGKKRRLEMTYTNRFTCQMCILCYSRVTIVIVIAFSSSSALRHRHLVCPSLSLTHSLVTSCYSFFSVFVSRFSFFICTFQSNIRLVV